jgi:peroxiredoxin
MKVYVLVVFVSLFVTLFGCAEKKENTSDNLSNEEQIVNSSISGNTSHVLNVKGVLSDNNIPSFSWHNEKGDEISLESYKGKVVIINFWATWCAPCRNEIPSFINVYNKYRSQGVEFLGISLDSQLGLDELAEFVGDNEINYQVILDNGNLEHAFGGVEAIPTTFIIGKNFTVKTTRVGALDEANLEKLIQSEL